MILRAATLRQRLSTTCGRANPDSLRGQRQNRAIRVRERAGSHTARAVPPSLDAEPRHFRPLPTVLRLGTMFASHFNVCDGESESEAAIGRHPFVRSSLALL